MKINIERPISDEIVLGLSIEESSSAILYFRHVNSPDSQPAWYAQALGSDLSLIVDTLITLSNTLSFYMSLHPSFTPILPGDQDV